MMEDTKHIINKLFEEYNDVLYHFKNVACKYNVREEIKKDLVKLETIYRCAHIIDNQTANSIKWRLSEIQTLNFK